MEAESEPDFGPELRAGGRGQFVEVAMLDAAIIAALHASGVIEPVKS